MEIKDLQGKLVAVLGYGMEGKAVAAYLINNGIKPVLFDQKPWQEWATDDRNAIKKLGINFIFGPDWLKELTGFDVVFRSPGIPLSKVKNQLPNSAIITSQTKWFFDHNYSKIIGITGTKGKGTTSTLIYEMLKAGGKNVYLTGNIGKTQPLDTLNNLKADDWVAYELSSFQLQDLHVSPHIGVVLMTTREHLDYHSDEKEYVEAKAAITKYQTAGDFAIINADFKNSLAIGEQGSGKKLYFSRKKEADCFVRDGKIMAGANFEFPISELQLKGEHNLENVMAAVLAARFAGCSDDAIKSAAAAFKGLEHRLEFVAQKQGIKFYNDSFSTTPETATAAILSFSEPLILILGGSKKNSDFTQLAKTIETSKNIKAIILIGEEAPTIRKLLNYEGALLEGAKNMAEIFSQIKLQATSGDVVLLSPACASFDMFKNYADRGNQFKSEVSKW